MVSPHRTTTNIDSIVDEVRFEIDAPDASIEHFTKRAITRFCEVSHFWQEDLGPITIIDGIDSYEIIPQRYMSIVQFERVSTLDDIGRQIELSEGRGDSDLLHFYADSPSSITFAPINDLLNKQVSVECSLKPVEHNNTFKFSELILQDYFEAIAAGVKSYLYLTPKQDWTDFQLGDHNKRLFYGEAGEAKVRVARNYAREAKKIQHKRREFF